MYIYMYIVMAYVQTCYCILKVGPGLFYNLECVIVETSLAHRIASAQNIFCSLTILCTNETAQ